MIQWQKMICAAQQKQKVCQIDFLMKIN